MYSDEHIPCQRKLSLPACRDRTAISNAILLRVRWARWGIAGSRRCVPHGRLRFLYVLEFPSLVTNLFSRSENLPFHADYCSVLKAVCERLSFRRRRERHSVEPRREKQRSTIQLSDAEIKPGNQFDCCDRNDNIARRVGFFIAWWF
jgi:hypothetical protein